jgi:hypothetical protein
MSLYKSCGNYIVVLEKVDGSDTSKEGSLKEGQSPSGTITNESRKSLDNATPEQKLHAKYRANKLKVIDIYHKWNKDIWPHIKEIKNTVFS